MSRPVKRGSRTWIKQRVEAATRNNKLANRYPCVCLRCHYEWKAKVKKPKRCSRCKSNAWWKKELVRRPGNERVRYWDTRVKYGPHGHRLVRGRLMRKAIDGKATVASTVRKPVAGKAA